MPLSLEQYATWLDTRDLPWPAPPEPEPAKARPHLKPLPGVRAVTWNVYGTLLGIAGGQFLFVHPTKFVMDAALEKTIQEFKMWGSMSRKPGQPSEYMAHIYENVLREQQAFPAGGERYPEVAADRIWEAILKKLLQKDYRFDTGFYGALNEYSRKIAYFFHASLQGTTCYPGAAAALRHVHDSGLRLGLLGDGQCFTAVQLQRGLSRQDETARLDDFIPPELRVLSYEAKAKPPSERLFAQALAKLAEAGIEPGEVLHVGSRLLQDLVPAKRLGMKTGLFAGDRASLQVTAEQLKQPATRPDVLLTELEQIREIVS